MIDNFLSRSGPDLSVMAIAFIRKGTAAHACAQCEEQTGPRKTKVLLTPSDGSGVRQLFLCQHCANPRNTDPRLLSLDGWPRPPQEGATG